MPTLSSVAEALYKKRPASHSSLLIYFSPVAFSHLFLRSHFAPPVPLPLGFNLAINGEFRGL